MDYRLQSDWPSQTDFKVIGHPKRKTGMMFIYLSTLHSDENLKAQGPIDRPNPTLLITPLVVLETRNKIACNLE